MKTECIVFEDGDRLIVDTRKPNANLMNDATRPFCVCERVNGGSIGRVTSKGRYATLGRAKAALRYLR